MCQTDVVEDVLWDLLELLQAKAPLAIACSGGLDSRFLCHAARLAKTDFLAIHVEGPHVPPAENRYALQYLADMDIAFLNLPLNPLDKPEVAANSRKRCYFCKKILFQSMKEQLRHHGEADRLLCDGTNFDDLGEYRPGLLALKEEGIFSPLAACNMDKACLRRLAKATQLPNPNQPSNPCLLTRFPYDTQVSTDELARIGACEEALRTFFTHFPDCPAPNLRLRICQEPILQITPFPPNLRQALREILASYKLLPCRLLITETVSGFFDRKEDHKELPLL